MDVSNLPIEHLCRFYSISFNKFDFVSMKLIREEFVRRKIDFWKTYEEHIEKYYESNNFEKSNL